MLILLHQQQTGYLDTQEKFDSLSNILVLVSKIIKQKPDLYLQLNNVLIKMIEVQNGNLASQYAAEKFMMSKLPSAIGSLLCNY